MRYSSAENLSPKRDSASAVDHGLVDDGALGVVGELGRAGPGVVGLLVAGLAASAGGGAGRGGERREQGDAGHADHGLLVSMVLRVRCLPGPTCPSASGG